MARRPRVFQPDALRLENRQLLAVKLRPPIATVPPQIKASADANPPTILRSRLTRQGIELTFSEPMDPSKVQNINNYYVRAKTTHDTSALLNFLIRGPFGNSSSKSDTTTERVALRSATYNPTTQTVTLVPTRAFKGSALTVMSPTQVKLPAKAKHRSQIVQLLTDLAGNPIDSGSNPGQFSARVVRESRKGVRNRLS